MELTISRVYPKARTWEGNYGPSAAVKVDFSDGSVGEYLTKPDKAEGIISQLAPLVGKPLDFEVEDRPERDGVQQRKLKSWPGKPQPGQFGGGGGGGRSYVPAWGNTEEGERFIQERTDRRTSLMQAVAAVLGTKGPQDIFEVADKMYGWLRASVTTPQTATPVQTPETASAAPQGTTAGKANGSKPPLTPEEAACRGGMRWLSAWMVECGLPGELRKQIAVEALGKNVDHMKNLTPDDWTAVKHHCQSLTDADIKGWQAVAQNAV